MVANYSPYTAFEAEGRRAAMVTCLRCGAALLLDEEKAMEIHDAWHAAPKPPTVARETEEPSFRDVTATRCRRHATIPPTIIPPETQECGVCMKESR